MNSDFVELVLESGDTAARALIDKRSATLRQLSSGGIQMIEGFGTNPVNKKSAGDILIPWVNRVRDGLWIYEGDELQLEINEVPRNNAIHGLLRNRPHEIISQSESQLVLRAKIEPTTGYPFNLVVETKYELLGNGIQVQHTVSNVGRALAPVAIGSHPYLKIGNVPTAELKIAVKAGSRVLVDDRMNPVGIQDLDNSSFDLNLGVLVGDAELDTAYCDLVADSDGLFRHFLTAPNGDKLIVWGDPNFKHVQVYTANDFDIENGAELAVAIEPTTAPPNAFNSGIDLKWLQPGKSWDVSWGIILERQLV